MNDATFDKLEFDIVREAVAACCATALGKRLARTMTPSTRVKTVRNWLDQVRELADVADEHGLPPMGGVHDIRNYVHAAAFPAPLEPEDLAQVADTLAASRALHAWLVRAGEAAPSLSRLVTQVHDLSPIAEAISDCISPRGEVVDHASRKLSSIRSAIETARARVRSVFERILRSSSQTKLLQYAGSTFHNDRMVLPLKAEHRGRIAGIIHRSSDTGATLFVEPNESVELNNSIVRLRDEESKEVTRILRLLSQKIHANATGILSTLRGIGVLDLVVGKRRYAQKRACVCPTIDETGVLDLHEARHPVLLEVFDEESDESAPARTVVPIDVRLGSDFDVLVLTGPNTGGKTVCLKTVGLIALMTQCGIPIPADEGSCMPVYQRIFIDVGDEQSLQQSLSTFSSHMATQLDIMRRSGPQSLVLIDELGAGTDPDEGAAIGRAVLIELLALGAKAIVTTHLSALKAVAFTTPRVDNACVEFDAQSLRPTYRLRLGEPGNSQALIIAKRLGMPARLVQAAKGFLDDRTRALNQAIAGTLRTRREAEAARRDARDAALAARRQQDQYERDRDELVRRQEAHDFWAGWVKNLQPGDAVFIKTLQRDARVVRMELHQQRALVSTGTMDIEVPLRDLEATREKPGR